MPKLTVIVLTFNSANTLGVVLGSVASLSDRTIVVDSFSSDETKRIAEECGAEFVQHDFENYSRQRQWAERYAQVPADGWILHLDSDEVLTDTLASEIERVTRSSECDAYLLRRLSFFWGNPIRHGHMNPSWHLRLYRSGKAWCEDRLYDQHFVTTGRTEKLKGLVLDLQLGSVESWVASHNRWSSAEAAEVGRGDFTRQLASNLFGDRRERKRWLKNNVWYRTPPLARALAFFVYSYFFKLGFLDGRSGLVYHVLHAFWFRFVVDAKIIERRHFAEAIDRTPTSAWLLDHRARVVPVMRKDPMESSASVK